ncbi:rhamnan synthesis F family protein [Prosthecomicrobium pneumaticum]|uniref:Lipopolysaccharide biosynthesis protein n=1 Tax=Prosthecomicrobium pneumaticum TaxID=81895 RepID=A0A7W9L2H8_9HYPH|nr:rhamnan synthesis F family protein [Prosthecomicrobium pneumaticum]MBB5753518.1 lipopolysaccharide biosynthesis protein [Prosthecomicrobium pneumaticum]
MKRFAPDQTLSTRLTRLIRDWWTIRRHGAFDAAHYRAQLERTRFKHRLALLHYLWAGERKGLTPNPRFDPRLHRLAFDDVPPAGAALADAIRRGRQAPQPVGEDREAPMPAIPVEPPGRPLALVCHVFFQDVWPELEAGITPIADLVDLFVTITERPGAAALATRIRARFPRAVVLVLPNRGRDMLPFVLLAGAVPLSRYRAVCKIHTKKSQHRLDGAAWRRALVGPLIADAARVAAIGAHFAAHPRCGLVVPDGSIEEDPSLWGGNRVRTRALAARLGVAVEHLPLRFPAGSMYWISGPLVARIAALGLGWADFEPERGQTDDTTAHALERLVGLLATAEGLDMIEAGRLG